MKIGTKNRERERESAFAKKKVDYGLGETIQGKKVVVELTGVQDCGNRYRYRVTLPRGVI